MNIHYVTSNSAKFEEAALILDLPNLQKHGIQIQKTPYNLEEIQGTKEEIAMHKIKEARRHFNEPCIIDDVSLFCPALGGLPGPYIRSFLQALGDEKLAELISHYEDRSCSVTCTIAFSNGGEPLLFEGTVEAAIVKPRGARKHGTSWNAIVEPIGFTQTYAEMTLEQMSTFSPRSKALSAFKNYLLTEHR